MTTTIHPTALVEPGAQLGEGVTIGPFCQVGPDVKLGDGVRLHGNAIVTGDTTIGDRVEIFPFAVIGGPPQILGMKPGPSAVIVGHDTILREHVTIHAGSPAHSQVTRVGAHCFIMVSAHIAHDCVVADRCVFANNVSLAGHVQVGEQVWIGGHSAVHQFARLGAHSFIAGGSFVVEDVLPYAFISFDHPYLAGMNVNGLKRRGFSKQQMHTIRAAYRSLFSMEGTMAERAEALRSEFEGSAEAQAIVDFILADAKRPICKPGK